MDCLLIVQAPFTSLYHRCVPEQVSLPMWPLSDISLTAGHLVWVQFSWSPRVRLSYPSLYGPSRLLCKSCLVSPQLFFRRYCSICGCVFGVYVEVSLGSSCATILDSLPQMRKLNFFLFVELLFVQSLDVILLGGKRFLRHWNNIGAEAEISHFHIWE